MVTSVAPNQTCRPSWVKMWTFWSWMLRSVAVCSEINFTALFEDFFILFDKVCISNMAPVCELVYKPEARVE